MINLFKKIYTKYDSDLRSGKQQNRIIVTDRNFPYPITSEPDLRKKLGILGYYTSPDELLKEYGSIEAFLTYLISLDEKVCVITTSSFATQLQISVYKSLVKNPTAIGGYALYRSTYMHHRAISLRQIGDYDNDLTFKGNIPEVMTSDVFSSLYASTNPIVKLKGLEASDIPIELLMANYMGQPYVRTPKHFGFLMKYRNMVLENAIYRIRILRNEIMTNSVPVSAYLGAEVDEIHALDALIAHPATAWIADDTFSLYSQEDAGKKYSVAQLLAIYDSIEQLMKISIEEKTVLQHLTRGEIADILILDVEDEKGNFIGTEGFVAKVNGVFINKCYQEKRKENLDFFKPFLLHDDIAK